MSTRIDIYLSISIWFTSLSSIEEGGERSGCIVRMTLQILYVLNVILILSLTAHTKGTLSLLLRTNSTYEFI